MGSSNFAKETGQAQSVQMGSYSDVDTASNSMLIALENIDPAIHNLVSIGDSVSVKDEGILQVFTSQGRLGDIPAHAENQVRSEGLTSGEIASLSKTPLMAVVRLST